jgi:hypothetical protein
MNGYIKFQHRGGNCRYDIAVEKFKEWARLRYNTTP